MHRAEVNDAMKLIDDATPAVRELVGAWSKAILQGA